MLCARIHAFHAHSRLNHRLHFSSPHRPHTPNPPLPTRASDQMQEGGSGGGPCVALSQGEGVRGGWGGLEWFELLGDCLKASQSVGVVCLVGVLDEVRRNSIEGTWAAEEVGNLVSAAEGP